MAFGNTLPRPIASAHIARRLTAAAAVALLLGTAHAQSVLRNMSDNRFAPMPGLPSCLLGAVQSGNPANGPSIILFKANAGCTVPWHWHTPTENVMMVSGAAKIDMKTGAPSVVLHSGGYASLPGKHVHQFTCTSACSGFVTSDMVFDIHYVDATGKEVAPETALGKSR